MKRLGRITLAAAFGFTSLGCWPPHYYGRSLELFRVTVTGPDQVARIIGCGFYSTRHEGRISFRAAPGEDIVESVTWERVTKLSEQYFREFDAADEAFWCNDNQAKIETTRTPYRLGGEECLTTSGSDPVAELNAVELIDSVSPEVASGVRLRLKVKRSGPLALTYKFPCDANDRWRPDAWVPPVWTELNILP